MERKRKSVIPFECRSNCICANCFHLRRSGSRLSDQLLGEKARRGLKQARCMQMQFDTHLELALLSINREGITFHYSNIYWLILRVQSQKYSANVAYTGYSTFGNRSNCSVIERQNQWIQSFCSRQKNTNSHSISQYTAI